LLLQQQTCILIRLQFSDAISISNASHRDVLSVCECSAAVGMSYAQPLQLWPSCIVLESCNRCVLNMVHLSVWLRCLCDLDYVLYGTTNLHPPLVTVTRCFKHGSRARAHDHRLFANAEQYWHCENNNTRAARLSSQHINCNVQLCVEFVVLVFEQLHNRCRTVIASLHCPHGSCSYSYFCRA
jgi:hypothetical protein